MKKIIVMFLALAAVVGMSSCKSPSPSDTVDAYYKALQNSDFEKAMSYTDLTDSEEIKKQVEKYQGFNLKITEYEILSETVSDDGNSAVVEVRHKITSSFDETPEETTQKMNLVKVDGKWKIHE